MRAWALIAIGLVVALVAVLGPPWVQLQKDLRATRASNAELESVVANLRARNAELESVVTNLKKELDAANQARTQLQGGLDEANSEIERRQFEVERLTTELEQALALAKDAEALHQRDSASEPSDGQQPQ